MTYMELSTVPTYMDEFVEPALSRIRCIHVPNIKKQR